MIAFIDKKDRVVVFRGKRICLSKKEFLLFELIAKNPKGSCIDNEIIISYIWGERGKGVTTRNISQLTYLVRKKIKELPIDISHSKNEGIYTLMHRKIFFLNSNWSIIKKFMKLITQDKKTTHY